MHTICYTHNHRCIQRLQKVQLLNLQATTTDFVQTQHRPIELLDCALHKHKSLCHIHQEHNRNGVEMIAISLHLALHPKAVWNKTKKKKHQQQQQHMWARHPWTQQTHPYKGQKLVVFFIVNIDIEPFKLIRHWSLLVGSANNLNIVWYAASNDLIHMLFCSLVDLRFFRIVEQFGDMRSLHKRNQLCHQQRTLSFALVDKRHQSLRLFALRRQLAIVYNASLFVAQRPQPRPQQFHRHTAGIWLCRRSRNHQNGLIEGVQVQLSLRTNINIPARNHQQQTPPQQPKKFWFSIK